MKRLLSLLCLFFVMHVSAQETDAYEDTTDLSADSAREAFYDRPVDSDAVIRSYKMLQDSFVSRKKQKQYAWNDNIDSILRARSAEALKRVTEPRKVSGSSGFFNFLSSDVVQTILIVIGVLVLLFLAVKLTGAGGMFAIGSRSKSVEEIKDAESATDHHDPGAMKRSALQRGDLRSAVRFGFILLLAELADRNLITRAPDKTNAAYRSELPEALRADFRKAAMYFDYTWYGHAQLTQADYLMIDALFESLKRRSV